MDKLFHQFPWRSKTKWLDAASRHGFEKIDAEKYYKTIDHDFKLKRHDQEFLPIFSRKPKCYQFDTLIQSKGHPWLIFINTNSRKGYAYPMKNKSSKEVLEALRSHLARVGAVTELESDEDPSYLSAEVQDFMLENHINHITTEENNHHILGIINRFTKTIRDLNQDRDITDENMNSIIEEYNSSKHSSIDKAPDKFDHKDEVNWMNDKMNETHNKESVGLPEGSLVKLLNEGSFQKRRMNYSKDSYRINSRDGHQYIVEAGDKSVGRYPGYKLKSVGRGKLAETMNDDKYGIVKEIKDFNPKRNKYKLVYEGGVEDEVNLKILRKGNPMRLYFAEIEYWNRVGGKYKLPSDFKKLV
jgi:hypothetical protein